jgi:endonuclease G, mitochondrial
MALLDKSRLLEVAQRFNEQQGSRSIIPQSDKLKQRMEFLTQNELDTPQQGLERIQGNNNLVSVSFLLRGYEVAQAIGLIYNIEKPTDSAAVGTGFLVAPGLMITNHHVIEDQKQALSYGLRMNYQRDLDGRIEDAYDFVFRPDLFFATDPALDFTIVAVESTDVSDTIDLSDFGYLKLIEQTGKILEGESATIIQHPDGRPKQIAIFDSEITNIVHPNFLLYKTDTIGGSSGSPVFSSDWLVVALHHAGVPTQAFLDQLKENKVDESQLQVDHKSNEGIRVSAILNSLKNLASEIYEIITNAAKANLEESLPINFSRYDSPFEVTEIDAYGNHVFANQNNTIPMNSKKNSILLNIPLEIRLGRFEGPINDDDFDDFDEEDFEKKRKRRKRPNRPPNNSNRPNNNTNRPPQHNNRPTTSNNDPVLTPEERNGYNAEFVEGVTINLADLYQPFSDKKMVAPLKTGDGHELHYTNFSVVMHKVKRMCILTAVNIDGTDLVSIQRDNDKWFLDGRMDLQYQLDNSIYYSNDLDRGHMVRRKDPNWGPNAAQANNDTFFFTNACPQHKDLNQKTWLSLEDYVLNSTDTHGLKVSVFTGPILDENYVPYRQAIVPVQFYKIVAMTKKDGKASITGYVLTQKELISGLERARTDFVFGQFKTYQVSLRQIQEMTGLKLENLLEFDPLNNELEGSIREIESGGDIKL